MPVHCGTATLLELRLCGLPQESAGARLRSILLAAVDELTPYIEGEKTAPIKTYFITGDEATPP